MPKQKSLFTVIGIKFYEDPRRGDEAPMLARLKNGNLVRSPWYDRPTADEVREWLAEQGEA